MAGPGPGKVRVCEGRFLAGDGRVGVPVDALPNEDQLLLFASSRKTARKRYLFLSLYPSGACG